MEERSVTKVVKAINTSDGAGVKLKRSIGSSQLSHVDPFLLLDEFKSEDGADYIAGFPEHPHRGFETVTYMIHGKMEHKDSFGNRGVIESGGIQWMTAGRGIVHSEMPLQENGLLWGFQLWVNLPASHKMIQPRYQDLLPSTIPVIEQENGIRIKVIAGEFYNTETNEIIEGPVKEIITEPLYLDVYLPSNRSLTIPLTSGHTTLAYPFEGVIKIKETTIHSNTVAVLSEGESVRVFAEENARFLLIAGKPLKEPIVRNGPFVMNTKEELQQAYNDFFSNKIKK